MRYAVISFLLTVGLANADTIAYDFPVVAGNQSFGGPLGMDFNVNSPIEITALGVFDSNADGLNSQLTVYIYDRTTGTALAQEVFATGNTGTLVDGERFLALATPLDLAAGFQGSIVAEGYNVEVEDNNALGVGTTNSGGGLISFVGSGRYGTTAGSFPTIVDVGAANHYGAGTFEFTALKTTATPEPGPGPIVGCMLVFGAFAKFCPNFIRRDP
jgi:hypothetical protein